MRTKMKTIILIAVAACLTISLIVAGVVVAVLVKGNNQIKIQKAAEKNAADMAEAARQNKLDMEAAARKNKLKAAEASEFWLKMGEKEFNTIKQAEYYTRAIEKDGGNAPAYAFRGLNYLLRDKNLEAVSDITRAMDLDPRLKNAKQYSHRGQAYDGMGNHSEAVSDLT